MTRIFGSYTATSSWALLLTYLALASALLVVALSQARAAKGRDRFGWNILSPRVNRLSSIVMGVLSAWCMVLAIRVLVLTVF